MLKSPSLRPTQGLSPIVSQENGLVSDLETRERLPGQRPERLEVCVLTWLPLVHACGYGLDLECPPRGSCVRGLVSSYWHHGVVTGS
jgi:hypothetical protein